MIELFDIHGNSVPVFDVSGDMVFGPPQGGGPVTPEADKLPPILSDTHAQLRPTGRVVFEATIANDGTGDYASAGEAFDAAKAVVTDKKKAENWAIPDFHYQCRFFIKAGVYEQAISWAPKHAQIYGEGIDSTIFIGPASGSPRGVLEVGEGWMYMEGIKISHERKDAEGVNPVYPVHAKNIGVTTYVGCEFTSSVGGVPYGMDGGSYGQTTFYRCRFGPGTPNIHGWDQMTSPETICFIEHEAGSAGYNGMWDGGVGEVWCSGAFKEIRVRGIGTTTHVAPGTVGTEFIDGTRTERTDWPIPTGGLTPHWREKLGV